MFFWVWRALKMFTFLHLCVLGGLGDAFAAPPRPPQYNVAPAVRPRAGARNTFAGAAKIFFDARAPPKHPTPQKTYRLAIWF